MLKAAAISVVLNLSFFCYNVTYPSAWFLCIATAFIFILMDISLERIRLS